MTPEQARGHLPMWRIQMQTERVSPHTLTAYQTSARQYLDWCEQEGHQPFHQASLRAWSAQLLTEAGKAPATVRLRLAGVRSLAAFLTGEGELAAFPFPKVKAPSLDDDLVTEPLALGELQAMVKACRLPAGRHPYTTRLLARRDEALLRLLIETGCRASELANMTMADVANLGADTRGSARIIGKGRKERPMTWGPEASLALMRYLKLREQHKLADSDRLWLGAQGKGFGYQGLYHAMIKRAELAGVADFHPHKMRHTFAHRWLDAGGDPAELMDVCGWEHVSMVRRYSKAQRHQRAAATAARLNLGNLSA